MPWFTQLFTRRSIYRDLSEEIEQHLARSAPQRQQAEGEEGGDGPERFGCSERHKTVDQDAGSKGRQGAQQWMLPCDSRWLRRGSWSGACRECVLSFERPIFI